MAMREKDISRLLTDEYAERILVATQNFPRSVQEISDKYNIPIAACYRKIHELEEAGFLKVAEIVTTPKGKTMKLYRSLLRSAVLVYEDGVFKVKFDFDYEKDINGRWIELNSPNGS
jgi:DNA-binding Lrp family transcriptional regulator